MGLFKEIKKGFNEGREKARQEEAEARKRREARYLGREVGDYTPKHGSGKKKT